MSGHHETRQTGSKPYCIRTTQSVLSTFVNALQTKFDLLHALSSSQRGTRQSAVATFMANRADSKQNASESLVCELTLLISNPFQPLLLLREPSVAVATSIRQQTCYAQGNEQPTAPWTLARTLTRTGRRVGEQGRKIGKRSVNGGCLVHLVGWGACCPVVWVLVCLFVCLFVCLLLWRVVLLPACLLACLFVCLCAS